MSRKTTKFAKQIKQATSKGRDVKEAPALLIPTHNVIGDGTSERGGKRDAAIHGTKGGEVTKPRRKPLPPVQSHLNK